MVTATVESRVGNAETVEFVPSDVEARRAVASVRQRLFGNRGTPAAPPHIGPYQILRRIGEGGMGIVYECHDPRLERRVAVKVVRPRRATNPDKQRARLIREARSLARISHPNVIEIYDVGTVGDEVFIAMELVEGPTLGEWLRERTRKPVELLPLFEQIGRGLAAAHRAGITHRDFKPANVIVGSDGRPRVLDFGIAGAAVGDSSTDVETHPSGVSLSNLTADGFVLGTPAYMAPEQACGGTIDARSDQFSFAVVLYEALCGECPFAANTGQGRLQAIEHAELSALDRQSLPARLRRALRRALAYEAQQRHDDMDALLRELAARRRPVRWAAGLGATTIAVVLGVSLYGDDEESGVVQAASCEGATDVIDALWSKERRTGMHEAFATAAPVGGTAAWLRTETVLEAHVQAWRETAISHCRQHAGDAATKSPEAARTLACLDQRRRELSALLSGLDEPDAATVRSAPKAALAQRSAEECVDINALPHPIESPGTAAARDAIARADSLRELGRWGRAAEVAAYALRLAEETEDHGVQADAHLAAGRIASKQGDADESVEHLEQAIFLAQEAERLPTVARAAAQLMYVLGYAKADHESAKRWNDLANATITRLGGDSLLEAERLNALGAVYTEEAKFDEAIAAFEASLEVALPRLGARHPNTLSTRMNLGALYRNVGKIDEALELLEQARVAAIESLGPEHPDVADITGNIGVVHIAGGHAPLAVEPLERALAAYDRQDDPPSIRQTVFSSALSSAYARTDRGEEALVLARRSAALGEEAFGADNPKFAQVLGQLGDTLRQAGHLDEARRTMERSLRIKRASRGEDHPSVAVTLLGLSSILSAMGRHEDAKARLLEALPIAEGLPVDHPHRVLLEIHHAKVELDLGHHESALRHGQIALDRIGDSGKHPGEAGLAMWAMARALTALERDPERARRLVEQAHTATKETRPGVAGDMKVWLESHAATPASPI